MDKPVNKVTEEMIFELQKRVTLVGGPIEGTTSTLLMAFLDGKFFLGSEVSACVDPAEFDPQTGFNIAREKLFKAVTNRLWEFEGYRLYRSLEQSQESTEENEATE